MSVSERIYRASLRLYPTRFLYTYGERLQQLFRDQLRDADTGVKRIRPWLGTIVDLLCSVPRMHMDDNRSSPEKRMTWIAYLLCAISMVLLFRFESGSDDAGVVSGMIVLMTFMLGFIRPRRAWQWPLLIGLGVPGAHLASGGEVPPVAGIPGLVVLAVFVLAMGLAGTYAGVLARRVAARAFGE